MASSTPAAWSEAPQDILDLIIDRLVSSRDRSSSSWGCFKLLSIFSTAGFDTVRRARSSADGARFRAVCSSWRQALRQHVPAPRQLPWIVMTDGSFLTLCDSTCRTSTGRLPLAEDARCVGSTDGWLALDCTDDAKKMRSYFLHNPFTSTTVPLPELDRIIGDVSKLFEIRKVLMRSTPCDVVALLTNDRDRPLILLRPGKGAWVPEPQTAAYFVYIVDIAFLGDKLYGITRAEDLLSFAVDLDQFEVWSHVDNNFKSRNSEKGNKEKVVNNGEDNNNEAMSKWGCQVRAFDELEKKKTSDNVVSRYTDVEVPYEPNGLTVMRYLVESCGKLLMVRRQLPGGSYSFNINYTCKVEVFEADVSKGAHWVPVSGGLGGQALFVSNLFSKSISNCEAVEQDAIHFIDTGEKYDTKSQTLTAASIRIDPLKLMWIFSPELVV